MASAPQEARDAAHAALATAPGRIGELLTSLVSTRADAVAAYMTGAGIAGSRITAMGVGSAEPLVNGTGARARRLNRRIDVELSFP